MNVEYLKDN